MMDFRYLSLIFLFLIASILGVAGYDALRGKKYYQIIDQQQRCSRYKGRKYHV